MFTPPQQQIIESGILTTGFNCILQMPTGSGKTWLAEYAMNKALDAGYRCIYLTPLRALADELMERWGESMAPHSVGVFTGDYGKDDRPYPVPFHKARLLVMTPERLDACTRHWRAHWNWIPEVDLVVVDEFHLLGDRNRGARLEGALSRFRRLNPFSRLLCLSATLGNRFELADWLQGVEFSSDWRPVPLSWRTVKFRKASDKPDLLESEVVPCLKNGGKSLVFVQSRRRAEELANRLKSVGIRAQHHHAGMSLIERKRVESDFRGNNLDVLIATATLEMGLNLPVRQVVLYDLQRYTGQGFQPLPVTSVWQRAGRAGRRGLDESGEVVLFTPSWEKVSRAYELGEFEPIISGFSSKAQLVDQIVTEVSCGLARTHQQLESVFQRSLAYHQNNLPKTSSILLEMIKAGMIVESAEDETKSPMLKATKLGRAACRHLLAPGSILLFKSVLDRSIDLTLFDLLLVSASAMDCEPVLTVDFEELEVLSELLHQERSYLLRDGIEATSQILSVHGKRLLSSIKMALALRAWTRTGDLEVTSESLNCYPFEVKALIESTERLLMAMKEVFRELDDEEHDELHETASNSERIEALVKMVSGGLDELTATLTLIPGIGPKLARKLVSCGITDLEELAGVCEEDLYDLHGVSEKRKALWIEKAEELVKTRSAFFFKDDGPRISSSAMTWDSKVDPYRFRRSLELQVETISSSEYRVTGGLDPHMVNAICTGIVCDCQDAGKGNICKHQMAVRMAREDKELLELKKQMKSSLENQEISLADLWFSQSDDKWRIAI